MRALVTFLAIFVVRVIPEDAVNAVEVSPECAAVILAGSGVLGGTIAYIATPALMCSIGFCQAGPVAGSLATWWQSTLPLVAKGSIFSTLQSAAMAGVGSQTILIGASVGGSSSAAMIERLCSSVDNLDPTSKRGRIVLSTLSAVRSAIPYFGASKKTFQSAIQTISSATQNLFTIFQSDPVHIEETEPQSSESGIPFQENAEEPEQSWSDGWNHFS